MASFELLGLASDADERAIKRAYAQRLRRARPEDDPAGFQQLHAAYQAALQSCRDTERGPNEAALDDVAAVAAPAATPAAVMSAREWSPPIEPPGLPTFDRDAFCIAAFDLANAGDAAALLHWLEDQHDLWSLQRKAQTGQYLLQQLHQQVPPMPSVCLDTLLQFFHLDHALAGHDPLALMQLERRMRLAWQLQSEDQPILAARLGLVSSAQQWRAHLALRQLEQPFSWPQVFFHCMNSINSIHIADFVNELTDRHPEDLPASINPAQLDFWMTAAESDRVTGPRLIQGAARAVPMLLLGAFLAPWLSFGFTGSIALRPMLAVVGIMLIPSLLWLLWMGWIVLDPWHGRVEPLSRHARSWGQCLVPALCLAGSTLGLLGGVDVAAFALVILALWLAWRRYWQRYPARGKWQPNLLLLLAIPLLFKLGGESLGEHLLAINLAIAGAAMLVWTFDQWKQRLARRAAH